LGDIASQRLDHELRQKSVTYLSHIIVNREIKTPGQEEVTKSEVKFTINNDGRMAVFQHPNSALLFKDVPVKEKSKLEFGISEIPSGKPNDGAFRAIASCLTISAK
jgi:hypothetical protein